MRGAYGRSSLRKRRDQLAGQQCHGVDVGTYPAGPGGPAPEELDHDRQHDRCDQDPLGSAVLAAQIQEGCLDTTIHVLGLAQVELEEDCVDMALDGSLGDRQL